MSNQDNKIKNDNNEIKSLTHIPNAPLLDLNPPKPPPLSINQQLAPPLKNVFQSKPQYIPSSAQIPSLSNIVNVNANVGVTDHLRLSISSVSDTDPKDIITRLKKELNENQTEDIYTELKDTYIQDQKKKINKTSKKQYFMAPITVLLSIDDNRMASGCEDGTIRVWDIKKKRQIGVLEGHMEPISGLVLFSDPKLKIISSSYDKLLIMWDIEKEREIFRVSAHTGPVNDIKLGIANKLFSCSNEKFIKIWEIKEKEISFLLNLETNIEKTDKIKAICNNKEGSKIIAITMENSIRLVETIKDKKEIALMPLGKEASCLVCDYELMKIFVGFCDGEIYYFRINMEEKFELVQKFIGKEPISEEGVENKVVYKGKFIGGHNETIKSMVIYEDKLISSGEDLKIIIWELDGSIKYKFEKIHTQWITSIVLSSKETSLYTGSTDKTIQILDLKKNTCVGKLEGFSNSVLCLAISQVSKDTKDPKDTDKIVLVSGNTDNTVRIFLKDRFEKNFYFKKKSNVILEGHLDWVNCILISSDNSKIYSGSNDKSVILWGINEKKLLHKFLGHAAEVKALDVNQDQTYMIAGCSDGFCFIWNLNTKSIEAKCDGHSGGITSIKLIGENTFSSGCVLHHSVKIWNFKGEHLNSLLLNDTTDFITALAASPIGTILIGGTNENKLYFWNYQTLNKMNTFDSAHGDAISSLSINSKGTLLVSGSLDKKVILWDIVQGCRIGPMGDATSNHSKEINSVAISDKLGIVVSGSWDQKIKIWNYDDKKMIDCIEKNPEDITCVCFSYDKKSLIIGKENKEVEIKSFDEKNPALLLKSHANAIRTVFALDNEHIISGGDDNAIRVTYIGSKRVSVIVCLRCHSNSINSVFGIRTTPNTFYIISGSSDCTIRINRIKIEDKKGYEYSEKRLDQPDIIQSIIMTNDKNKMIAACDDKTIKIWNVNNLNFFDLKEPDSIISSLSYKNYSIFSSPDSVLLFCFTENNMVFVWDIQKLILINSFSVHQYIQGIIPIFLSDNGRFVMIYEKIYDIYNGDILKSVNINPEVKFIIYNEELKTTFNLNKNGSLTQAKESLAYILNQSLKQKNFYETNFSDSNKLEEILSGENILFPFFYSFLHLISIYESESPFTFEKLKTLIARKAENRITLSQLLKVDIFTNTCLDIMILKSNKSVISNYFDLIFEALKEETSFNLQFNFFNFNFKPLIKKRKLIFESEQEMLDILNKLIVIYGNDLSIVSKLIEKSFINIHESLYNNDVVFHELQEPVFMTVNSIYSINKQIIEERLKRNDTKVIRGKNAVIKCKVVCIPGLIELDNENNKDFYKKLLEYPSDHSIFSNKVLRMITDYKWNYFTKTYFKREFLGFLIAFLLFISNVLFFFPLRIENSEKDQSSNNYFYFSLVIDLLLFLYAFYSMYQERIQIKNNSWKKYFSSIWNYLDLFLISFILFSTIIDPIVIFTSGSIPKYIYKSIYTLTVFLFWIRIISYSRGFDGTSFMIGLLFRVISDIRHFLFIVLMFVCAFACSVHMIQTDADYNIKHTFDMFYRLTLGDFNYVDDADVESQFLLWIFSTLSTVLLTIILLNLLISIIGDTYQSVSKSKEQTRNYELMNINFEIENSFTKYRVEYLKERKYIGKYLVYLYNEENTILSDEEDNKEILTRLEKAILDNNKIDQEIMRKLDLILNSKEQIGPTTTVKKIIN